MSLDWEALNSFVTSDAFARIPTATERYLSLLGTIRRAAPDDVEAALLGMERYSRVYFARSREEIEVSGRSTQPQRIPGSQLWALTNMRAAQKLEILLRVLQRLSSPVEVQAAVSKVFSAGLSASRTTA